MRQYRGGEAAGGGITCTVRESFVSKMDMTRESPYVNTAPNASCSTLSCCDARPRSATRRSLRWPLTIAASCETSRPRLGTPRKMHAYVAVRTAWSRGLPVDASTRA